MDNKENITNEQYSSLALGSLNKTLDDFRKNNLAIIDSPSFQLLLEDMPRISQIADKMMKTYKIFAEQEAKRQKAIESLIKPMALSLKMPNILESNTEMRIHRQETKYSRSEIENIAKILIKEVIEEVKSGNIEINSKHRCPYNLPKNLQWENITIKFKDRHNVQIVADEYIYLANYKEMGFEDSRKLIPNQQWLLLEVLSKLYGKISWDDNNANNSVKKKKQLLANVLKTYFGISEDPFHPYRKEKGYQIRINLIPDTGSINQEVSKNDDLGIEDLYKEITEQE